MKCKTCAELGLTSTLSVVSNFATLMCDHQYFDEQGRYHLHDPNTTSTVYRCSNGHSTVETSRRHCPTCKPKEAVPGGNVCHSVEQPMHETTSNDAQRD